MLRSKFQYNIVINSIRFLFIILFVYAATSKLLILEQFKIQLQKSPFISSYADLLTWGIPLLEYIIVGLFLISRFIHFAFYISLGLMTVFTIYIFLVLNISESIPCSCGGVISNLDWKEHFVFNILFMFLALLGILLINKQKTNHIKNYTT